MRHYSHIKNLTDPPIDIHLDLQPFKNRLM